MMVVEWPVSKLLPSIIFLGATVWATKKLHPTAILGTKLYR